MPTNRDVLYTLECELGAVLLFGAGDFVYDLPF